MPISSLRDVVDACGGVSSIAKACKISQRAIYKWLSNESLPRTEYTGETDYAKKLAELSNGQFTKDFVLNIAKPKKAAA